MGSEFAAKAIPGVIRLRTLSKAHGLAGLRIGYAIADPDVLAMMMKVRIHYAVSSLTLAAAEVVLDHPDEVHQHVANVKARSSASNLPGSSAACTAVMRITLASSGCAKRATNTPLSSSCW